MVDRKTVDEHSWYCSFCRLGHLKNRTCPIHISQPFRCTDFYCAGCEKAGKDCIHGIYDIDLCEHRNVSWLCPSCNTSYNIAEQTVDKHAWYCPRCKIPHLKIHRCCPDQGYYYCDQCEADGVSCIHRENKPCKHNWECPKCLKTYSVNYKCPIDGYWRCDTDHVRVPVNQSCSGCTYWFCTICKDTYYNDTDTQGHPRPDLVNNAPLLHAKKTSSEQSPFINNIPLLDVFKGSSDPSKEVHSSNDVPEEKNLINTVERSVHSEGDEPKQRLLHVVEKLKRKKLKRKKEKLFREDLKKEYKHSLSSSSSSKGKDAKPHKKFIINMRKKYSNDEDPKEFDPKHPLRNTIRAGEHPECKCNGCKHTHAKNLNINVQTSALKKTTPNGSKREGYKPINSPKIELKMSKQSDSDKYPQLTQSHIKYSKQEDVKRLSSEKKEEKKVPQSSKGEGPKLEYCFDIGKHMRNINVAPSGLSDLEDRAKKIEELRVCELKRELIQASKAQSSKSKKDGISIVPPLSKIIKDGKEKKAAPSSVPSDNKESKKQSTFKPSSSSSDSDESETPKGNANDSKIYTNKPTDDLQIYTNKPTDDLQKNVSKKTCREDEGNETPPNSQTSSGFNLLKSPENQHAAPNASASKQNLTGFPSSQTEPQQIGFKTIEGPKEPSKSPKSDEETPKGDTPNGEMPKGETPKSNAKNNKSNGNSSSDEEKKSSHSKSSKKSSKKSVKTYSRDSHSEKHSDNGYYSLSDKENNKEGSSSEDAVSSHSKRSSKKSVKNDDIFDKSLAESIIVNNKPSDEEKQKNPDEESDESKEDSETPGK